MNDIYGGKELVKLLNISKFKIIKCYDIIKAYSILTSVSFFLLFFEIVYHFSPFFCLLFKIKKRKKDLIKKIYIPNSQKIDKIGTMERIHPDIKMEKKNNREITT